MKYKKTIMTICIIAIFLIGILTGAFLIAVGQAMMMEGYDLYNCVYMNAERNSFNKHPEMIKTIQDECICFRENNYTNILEADC